MYFTKGNRVVIRLGKDKKLQVLCVNGRFKYYSPIFETRAWKGKPIIRVDRFEDHVAVPYEFSDSDRALFDNFGNSATVWNLLSKYFVEKRGNFNETDDDYTLSSAGGETAMFMWSTELYLEQYEWYVRVDRINDDDDSR